MGTYKYPDIATAHEGVVRMICKKGYEVVTEDGEVTIESEPLTIVIAYPFGGKRISKCSKFSVNYMEAYSNALIYGYHDDIKFTYDYYSRMFDYTDGNSAPWGCDQIKYIVEKLVAEPASRRAQAITWIPKIDMKMKDVPCLQLIQCTIRDNKLNMNVVFRSNDMLMAFGANVYALTKLQEYICNKIGNIKIGTYTHTALIPHIYNMRDIDILEQFVGDV